jgi:hypothetical protein
MSPDDPDRQTAALDGASSHLATSRIGCRAALAVKPGKRMKGRKVWEEKGRKEGIRED